MKNFEKNISYLEAEKAGYPISFNDIINPDAEEGIEFPEKEEVIIEFGYCDGRYYCDSYFDNGNSDNIGADADPREIEWINKYYEKYIK